MTQLPAVSDTPGRRVIPKRIIMPQCKNCQKEFTIPDDDKKYYQKLELPEPTHCPDCRCQRRMVTRNERNLYPRKCGLCAKNILSMYFDDKPFPVYCRDCWYGDKWGAENYAQDYDWSRSFFEQFTELQNKIPRSGTLGNGLIVNSDYCNYLGDAKNCYLCFGSIFIENCLYGNPYYSKDCIDSLLIRDCELCYQCVTSEHLYSCFYCQDCFSSNSLYWCYDCKGCSDCIGCAGLRNAKHHIYNKKVTEEEYQKFKSELNFCDPDRVAETRMELEKNKLKTPRRYYQGLKNVKVSGDYINESKNSHGMFDVKRCEDSKYCAQVIDMKDCYDNNYCEENELCCDYISSWKDYRLAYSASCYQCNNLYYCDLCEGLKKSFGCCVLRKKEFCILNKQYTEPEYNEMVKKIIEQMKASGEWGEFFPIDKSIFGYNETVANEYFPITEEEASKKGWPWKSKDPEDYQTQTYQVPTDIKDVPDSILNEILACSDCGKNYKITKQELVFYSDHSLPIPNECPDCRHIARMKLRNPRQLWQRQCDKCSINIKTSYNPDRPEKVYCQECYEKEIY